jgi:hypothetical protein
MGAGTSQPMGQQGQQYTPGTFGPQNPQGVMALQNAYQQFQNGAPPQPNPMFGQQPMGNLQGAPLGGGMPPPPTQSGMQQQFQDFARQQQMGEGMPPQGPPASVLQGLPPQAQAAIANRGMPMAPATQQTRPEDPRMAAMRYMQQMKLGGR